MLQANAVDAVKAIVDCYRKLLPIELRTMYFRQNQPLD